MCNMNLTRNKLFSNLVVPMVIFGLLLVVAGVLFSRSASSDTKIEVKSSEVGFASYSPSGVAGGAIIPASCELRYVHVPGEFTEPPPPSPTGLVQSCVSPGTAAGLAWNPTDGATLYAVRADDTTKNGWNGLCDGAQNPYDQCTNSSTNTYTFPSQPGDNYGWWVHACNSIGCSAPTSGSSFTCVAMVQPNLITQSLSVSPSSPISGDLINFSGVIKNTGTANAGVSTSRLRFDIGNNGSYEYTWTNSTGALDTGAQETEIWADIPVSTTGTHGYEICADSASAVTESSESDNCATATFTVSAALTPDLLTDTLSVTPSSPVSGDLVDFSGIIRNSGSATAGDGT